MSFSSAAFILFMLAVFVVYFQIPHKFRFILLIFANFLFYGSFGSLYLVALLYIGLASWIIGIQFEKPMKKSGFIMCICAVLLPLFMYKYLNFMIHTVDKVLSIISLPFSMHEVRLLYPIGISFYTFESLSYILDVYNGKIKAERNFFKLLIFISFFPNIISGPIERAGNFLPQLDIETKFDYERSVYGFRLMLLGLFKKVVCADYLAVLADSVFDRVIIFKGPVFIVAIVVYTYQIYLDFSGYTDIARGAAHALGFNLCENFKAPYLSKSIKEFFARWHISLSTWLRDYIYIPLGGNRGGAWKKRRNLLITFLVSGLWHGANYTFIIWGLLHGMYQVCTDMIGGCRQTRTNFFGKRGRLRGFAQLASLLRRPSLAPESFPLKLSCVPDSRVKIVNGIKQILGIFVTFVLVAFAWLFFRVNSLGEAAYVLRNMFVFDNFHGQMQQMGFLQPITYVAVIAIIAFTIILDIYSEKADVIASFAKLKLPVRWICYIIMLTYIITMRSHIGADASFIYFSF